MSDGKFKKGQKLYSHKKRCQCPRCNSNFWKGRKHTEETKKKISEIQKSKSPYTKYRNKKWLEKKYLDEKLSLQKIADIVGCKSNMTIYHWLKEFRIKTRGYGNPLEKNPRWKGGKIEQKNGYIYVLAKNHPNVDKKGYYPEQNLVIEKSIGRYLKKNELVHHLDGDKKNNKLENLKLMKNTIEHHKFEQQVLLFAKKLIWGNLKPELKQELQNLFYKFSREK